MALYNREMKKIIFLLFIFLPFFVFASASVDLNTASLSQLDQLTGIGPTYAQRIIDARPYSLIDDLLKVKGIGPATLQKIKDQGLAYVSENIVQAPQAPVLAENPEAATNTSPTKIYTTEPNEDAGADAEARPLGIFINEVLPSPRGSDETDEWIELYNSNSFEVDLSGWALEDKVGTITNFKIPPGTKIPANSFIVFNRPQTKIMLNNNTDGVTLFYPNGTLVDLVSFDSAPLGQSYCKNGPSWAWSVTTTGGAKNIIPQKTEQTPLPKGENSVKNTNVAGELASISQGLNQEYPDKPTKNPWILFFITLGTTVVLAAITIFIKVKFLNENVRT